jgi:hypothetical protein
MRIKHVKYLMIMGLIWMMFLGYSQKIKTSFGVKFGNVNGITFKYFPQRFKGLETVIGITNKRKGYRFSQMFQLHKQAKKSTSSTGWMYYGGFGIHSSYYQNITIKQIRIPKTVNYYGFGVLVGGGCQYTFKKLPISFGFDVRPMLEILTEKYAIANTWEGGMFLRAVITNW